MTTRCAPACSQALPVKPQGGLGQRYWSVSVVTWPPKPGVSEAGVFRAIQPNDWASGNHLLYTNKSSPNELINQVASDSSGTFQENRQKLNLDLFWSYLGPNRDQKFGPYMLCTARWKGPVGFCSWEALWPGSKSHFKLSVVNLNWDDIFIMFKAIT